MPSKEELKYLQSLPLDIKIAKTKQRIKEWVNYYGVDGVYVSFSGGKDSTVLLHIVREMYPSIEAVFINTGLEYPEIQSFVKSFDNVTILRPKMRFDEVIKTYGYPLIGKEASERVDTARKCIVGGGINISSITTNSRNDFPISLWQILGIGGFFSNRYNFSKWKPLLEVDFKISNKCCNIMKKKPIKDYSKKRGKLPITAQTAEESQLRKQQWLKNGCNGFCMKHPISNPMSFWTEQDILQYIKQTHLPIASVYGEIITKKDGIEYSSTLCNCGAKLCTTGCNRTGCIFCGFGAHLEKGENRFQRLKRTHPKQYEYCLDGGAYDTDGLWKPTKDGLGMKHVFDELNRIYGKDFIKY